MDECEALCARVAIMVKGQFQCLGSIQHLRTRFGQGYTMTVKFKRSTLLTQSQDYIDRVHIAIISALPSAVRRDVHETVASYQITDVNSLWSTMFTEMESIKATFDLEDYILGDTTLEQIFVDFARHQQLTSK